MILMTGSTGKHRSPFAESPASSGHAGALSFVILRKKAQDVQLRRANGAEVVTGDLSDLSSLAGCAASASRTARSGCGALDDMPVLNPFPV